MNPAPLQPTFQLFVAAGSCRMNCLSQCCYTTLHSIPIVTSADIRVEKIFSVEVRRDHSYRNKNLMT